MPHILEVREFDTITCNKDYEHSPQFRYLDECHFRELEHFIREYVSDDEHADALDFMKIGYRRNVGDTISFNSNVGIIELPSGFQIEILPKMILGDDNGIENTKRAFLNMLCCLKEFEGKALGNAAVHSDYMNLYEIFINMYIQATRNLVKHGIRSSYIQTEENLMFYKGKLRVSEHIRNNMAHRERFYMQYDEYQANRSENRLVKATLLKLEKATRSIRNARDIHQLLTAFEFVEPSANYEKDFAQVSISRETKDYEFLIQWARVFLMNKSLTTFSGEKAGKAILFPMEAVFEAFVARWVRTVFENQSSGALHVSVQDKGYYLFDEPRKFRLRPDLVVREEGEDSGKVVIMDTKWKKLKPDAGSNYGISQADMYQMYAYSKKYQTSNIWLLYPSHPDVSDLGDISYIAVHNESKEVNVNVFFIDLAHYQKSIQELYSKIYL